MSHGGRRPGAGQPGKPRLTLAELERARTRCAEVRGGRMSAQGIVDAINEERTRGYLDPRSIAKLRVSTWWLRRQTKMLRESTPASEANLIDSTGTRFPAYQPTVQESTDVSERTTEPSQAPARKQVESEQSGAT